MDYFLELYGGLPRAGPGDNGSTRRAFGAMTELPGEPSVLDLGCGPGVQTLELLRMSDGTVTALDLLPHMLSRVERAAADAGYSDRLRLVEADMNAMAFAPESFDLVWSEGAIYIAGFRAGLSMIRPLIKPGGYAAVTDVVWLRPDAPAELTAFWAEYPEIAFPEEKQTVASEVGFEVIDCFTLPPSAWTEPYYDHLAARVEEFEPKWRGVAAAEGVLAEATREVDLFRRYSDWYGYAFFVLRRDGTTEQHLNSD